MTKEQYAAYCAPLQEQISMAQAAIKNANRERIAACGFKIGDKVIITDGGVFSEHRSVSIAYIRSLNVDNDGGIAPKFTKAKVDGDQAKPELFCWHLMAIEHYTPERFEKLKGENPTPLTRIKII